MEYTFETFRNHLYDEPQMYGMFRRFALEMANRREHYSARGIIHRMRWETIVNDGSSNYKVNDHWSPFYARKFMFEYPRFEGFFRTNDQKGSIYKNSIAEDYSL